MFCLGGDRSIYPACIVPLCAINVQEVLQIFEVKRFFAVEELSVARVILGGRWGAYLFVHVHELSDIP